MGLRYGIGMVNKFQVGPDGKTAHRRLRGKDFKRDMVEFGDCVMHLKLESRRELNPDTQRLNGL